MLPIEDDEAQFLVSDFGVVVDEPHGVVFVACFRKECHLNATSRLPLNKGRLAKELFYSMLVDLPRDLHFGTVLVDRGSQELRRHGQKTWMGGGANNLVVNQKLDGVLGKRLRKCQNVPDVPDKEKNVSACSKKKKRDGR